MSLTSSGGVRNDLLEGGDERIHARDHDPGDEPERPVGAEVGRVRAWCRSRCCGRRTTLPLRRPARAPRPRLPPNRCTRLRRRYRTSRHLELRLVGVVVVPQGELARADSKGPTRRIHGVAVRGTRWQIAAGITGREPQPPQLARDIGVALHVPGVSGPATLHGVVGEDRDAGPRICGRDLRRGGAAWGRRLGRRGAGGSAAGGKREDRERNYTDTTHVRPPGGEGKGEIYVSSTTRAGAERFNQAAVGTSVRRDLGGHRMRERLQLLAGVQPGRATASDDPPGGVTEHIFGQRLAPRAAAASYTSSESRSVLKHHMDRRRT